MNEDRRLVHFLQHHRPVPPPAPAQAEARLMQALAAAGPLPHRSWLTARLFAGTLLGLAIAGLGIYWWVGQRRAIALAETQRLEAALLEEWHASLNLAEAFYVDFVRDERP
ncbi:MAG: hypothetical protein SNJ60_02945 [Pseudanabaenaceae cyanobacterium]